MLNKLWPVFLIISIIYAIITGHVTELNNSIFNSADSAVELTIKLFGTLCLWNRNNANSNKKFTSRNYM